MVLQEVMVSASLISHGSNTSLHSLSYNMYDYLMLNNDYHLPHHSVSVILFLKGDIYDVKCLGCVCPY